MLLMCALYRVQTICILLFIHKEGVLYHRVDISNHCIIGYNYANQCSQFCGFRQRMSSNEITGDKLISKIGNAKAYSDGYDKIFGNKEH